MKKLILLVLSALALTSCGSNTNQNQCVCYKQKTYIFKVEFHHKASLTSETQEITYDPYLAYCVRGDNDAFIEVPYEDKRTELELIHTGYIITYDSVLSNNGWELVK